MNKSVYDQVFEIVDEMYNSLSMDVDSDRDVLKVLMTAGIYLS